MLHFNNTFILSCGMSMNDISYFIYLFFLNATDALKIVKIL